MKTLGVKTSHCKNYTKQIGFGATENPIKYNPPPDISITLTNQSDSHRTQH